MNLLPSIRSGGALALLAMLLLAACGGSGVDPFAASTPCSSVNPCPPPPLAVQIVPARQTAQVGAAATFRATLPEQGAALQWTRSSDGGRTFVDIAGATGATLTLSPVTLSDDATLVGVVAIAGSRSGAANARLAVSSAPPMIALDTEFDPSAWTARALFPAATSNPPTHAESQALAGGNPGAFRAMSDDMPVRTALSVVHTSLAAGYDPQASGAVHAIDYREDCINFHPSAHMQSALVIEQGGRTFASNGTVVCSPGAPWSVDRSLASLVAADFHQLDGPACPAGTPCLDFSASAAPLSFGYARSLFLAYGSGPLTLTHGIDNWTVSVWRR